MSLNISVLFLLLAPLHVLAATVTYDWELYWVTRNPDNRQPRRVIGVNGQWPLPTIKCDVGDRVVINVKNSLGDRSTAIHFHGLAQQGSNSMDGPAMVTQCPISTGSSFTYDFVVCN